MPANAPTRCPAIGSWARPAPTLGTFVGAAPGRERGGIAGPALVNHVKG